MTDVDYADDKALLANTPPQVESLQHSLEQVAVEGINLYVNVNQTEYICLEKRAITTLSSKHLNLVVLNFAYLGSNISSSEIDVNIRQAKA